MENLSKEEMKKVMGGQEAEPLYNCQCNGTGTWSGHYGSAQEIIDDINAYCENGGTCTAA